MTTEWVTYKRVDGELIDDQYAWVADREYFEEDELEYLEVVRETWALVSSEVVKFGTTDRWCAECEVDLRLEEPVDGPVFCPAHAPKATP